MVKTRGVKRLSGERSDINYADIDNDLENGNPKKIKLQDGAVAAPALFFESSPTSGLYSTGNGDTKISVAGTEKIDVNTNSVTSSVPVQVPNGGFSSPGLQFSDDPSAGVYRQDGKMVLTAGVISGTLLTMGNNEYFMNGNRVVIPEGTVGNPGLQFNINEGTGTGIFAEGPTDSVSIATNGVNQFKVSDTQCLFNNKCVGPEFEVSGSGRVDNANGENIIFNDGAQTITLQTNDQDRLVVDSGQCTFKNNLHVGDGQAQLLTDSGRHELVFVSDDTVASGSAYFNSRFTDTDTRVQIALESNYTARPVETSNPVSNGRYSNLKLVKNNQIGQLIDGAGKEEMIIFTDQGEIRAGGGDIGNDVTSPTYSFINDTDTGITNPNANELGCVVGGSEKLSITTSSVTCNTQLINQNGARISWNSQDLSSVTVGDGTNNFTGSGSGHFLRGTKNAGNSDWLHGYITYSWTDKGTASGNIEISTGATNCASGSPVPVTIGYVEGITAAGTLIAECVNGTDNIVLYNAPNNGSAPTRLTDTDFSNTGTIRIAFSYPTVERV